LVEPGILWKTLENDRKPGKYLRKLVEALENARGKLTGKPGKPGKRGERFP
jgi:hypothetical protein